MSQLALDVPDRTALFELLKAHSFQRGHFILASGQSSTYYLDCRKTTLHGQGSYLIGKMMHQILENSPVDSVGGMTLGADPIVSSIIYRSAEVGNPINGFLVRKEAKSHGGRSQIEGQIQPWMRVALVEDVVTTGSSTLKAIQAIRKQFPSVQLTQVLAIIDRNAGANEAFSRLGIPFQAIYNVEEFLQE